MNAPIGVNEKGIGMDGFAVTDPYTLRRLYEVPFVDAAGLEAALASVWQTWREWVPESSVAERAAIIAGVADLHEARKEELAEIIVQEMGKPLAQAIGEAEFAAEIYRFYATQGPSLLADEPIVGAAATALIRKAPLGPLLGVMPWNFPLYQVSRFAGPQLVAGNPILLKPAPQCPRSAEAIAAIFREAGAPAGAYVNLFASTEQVATAIGDPRVRGVSLTGSEQAGRAVAELAGRHLKKVVLELGGSDAFILMSTSDLDGAVTAAIDARLDNNGQSCNAAKRFIIADDLYDEFAAKLVAKLRDVLPQHPLDPDVVLGPLASEAAAERLDRQVADAIAAGAVALLGPRPRDGARFAPVVLQGVTPDNPVYHEELFGPAMVLHRVESEQDAIRIANDTSFGLGAYVWTDDPAQAHRMTDALDVGMVYLNSVLADSPELSFGGVKSSGFGRELGALGIGEFLNRKLVYNQSGDHL